MRPESGVRRRICGAASRSCMAEPEDGYVDLL